MTPSRLSSGLPPKPTPPPTSRCQPGAVSTRPNKSVTVATRLSPEDLADIERLAGRLDVPPSSLIRGWILSGLNAHKDETVQSTIEKISADVQRLRELVA